MFGENGLTVSAYIPNNNEETAKKILNDIPKSGSNNIPNNSRTKQKHNKRVEECANRKIYEMVVEGKLRQNIPLKDIVKALSNDIHNQEEFIEATSQVKIAFSTILEKINNFNLKQPNTNELSKNDQKTISSIIKLSKSLKKLAKTCKEKTKDRITALLKESQNQKFLGILLTKTFEGYNPFLKTRWQPFGINYRTDLITNTFSKLITTTNSNIKFQLDENRPINTLLVDIDNLTKIMTYLREKNLILNSVFETFAYEYPNHPLIQQFHEFNNNLFKEQCEELKKLEKTKNTLIKEMDIILESKDEKDKMKVSQEKKFLEDCFSYLEHRIKENTDALYYNQKFISKNSSSINNTEELPTRELQTKTEKLLEDIIFYQEEIRRFQNQMKNFLIQNWEAKMKSFEDRLGIQPQSLKKENNNNNNINDSSIIVEKNNNKYFLKKDDNSLHMRKAIVELTQYEKEQAEISNQINVYEKNIEILNERLTSIEDLEVELKTKIKPLKQHELKALVQIKECVA
ncbi:MAG: hypothetical protein Q8K60_02605 [Parachlamydiaceae bacterium]|nr:hypothetical protein [Parachlamydiaceae bacterium]